VRTQDGKTEYRDIDVVALFKQGGEASNEVVRDGDVLNVSRQPISTSTVKCSARLVPPGAGHERGTGAVDGRRTELAAPSAAL